MTKKTRSLSDFVEQPKTVSRPRSLEEAMQRTEEPAPRAVPKMEERVLSDAELRALEDRNLTPADLSDPIRAASTAAAAASEEAAPIPAATAPEAKEKGAIPEWANVPPNIRIPPGRKVFFLRFRADWTDRPDKGERQCIIWSLSAADEKLALERVNSGGARMIAELTKQTIRAIDGELVDWTRGPLSNVERFWDEIGSRCRSVLQGIYHQHHTLNAQELTDFFVQCMEVRSAI